jgi:hypothetical protein
MSASKNKTQPNCAQTQKVMCFDKTGTITGHYRIKSQTSNLDLKPKAQILKLNTSTSTTEDHMRFDSVLACTSPARHSELAEQGKEVPFELSLRELKLSDLIAKNDASNAIHGLLIKGMGSCHTLVGVDGSMVGNQVDMGMFGASGYEVWVLGFEVWVGGLGFGIRSWELVT